MIKCTLIEVDNDNRAVIIVGEDPRAEVVTTKRLDWIDYKTQDFRAGGKQYAFVTP